MKSTCPDCGKLINYRSRRCASCAMRYYHRANPRGYKPIGHFVYVRFDDHGIPIYVGSGQGERVEHKHEAQVRNISIIVRDNLSKDKALEIEAAFIAAIGIKPNGPLLNKATYGNS